jgi:outer membrane murein-binding lipoprotein Lpp
MPDKIGDFARNHWPAIAAVVAIATAWGASTAQIGAIASGQEKIAAKIDTMVENLATQKTTAQFAQRDIADLMQRVHAIETHR